MRENELLRTIEAHQAAFQRGDKITFDKLLRYYQGKFYTEEEGESESDMMVTSVNLVFAIAETALSTLIPAHPAITALARSPAREDQVKASEAYVNLALDASDYRDEQELFVLDAVILGRGLVKTTWNAELDMPQARACDPRSVWFDLTTRRPKDIRYWIEARLLGEDEYAKQAADLEYASWGQNREPDSYPKWMIPEVGDRANRDTLRNFQKWILMYEVYDIETGKVHHMLPGEEQPVMTDSLVYCPYDLLTLNKNGKDCRGLSEIALISPNQEEINNLLTYWLNIVRSCVPKGTYDPGTIDEKQFAAAVQAGPNTWSPLKTTGKRSLSESIVPFPMPQVPPDALSLLDKSWNNVTIVSALAEAQRGQVTGARTATELALIEGQLRNRLSSRQKRIDRVTAAVAQKMLLLMQKYKTKAEVLQITGQDGWQPIKPSTLRGIQAAFEVVPYSPMESNRAVVQEQFKDLLQYLMKNPKVDQTQLLRATVDIFDNPALRRYNIIAEQAAEAPGGEPAPAQPVDPAALAAAAGIPSSPAALPPGMQEMADAQLQAPSTQSPVIAAPGIPVGAPQMPG
jgi:hypothetical protein